MKKSFLFLVISYILLSIQYSNIKFTYINHENSLLWKIEKDGTNYESYLFGTMHLINKEYFYFPKSLEKIIKKCNYVVTEIDLNKLLDENNKNLKDKLLLNNGILWDYFDNEEKIELLKWSKEKLNLNEKMFNDNFSKFKPIVLIQFITQMSFSTNYESFEMKLSEIVDKFKIKTSGLESIEEQIEIFDKISINEQVNMLMETIRNFDKQEFELLRLQKNYRNQRLDSLSALMFDKTSTVKLNEQVFLYERNLKWIPKIEEKLSKEICFFAVGAGHLLEEKGLISLLKAKGYKLTPIKY